MIHIKQDFYIYFHICRSTGRTFYIGKGRGNRAKTIVGRNDKWHSYVFENDYDIYIYKDGLNEDEALKLEEQLISIHKDYGFLVNVVGVDTPPFSVQKQLTLLKRNAKLLQDQLKAMKVKKEMTLEEFEEKHKDLIALGAVEVSRPTPYQHTTIYIDRFVPPKEGEQYGTFLCEHKRLLPAQADVRKMGFFNVEMGVYVRCKHEN